ncbi:C40 family peptidase [Flavobacteriaceae bacterium TP-CH-4]|uniref:C40 family peptidase n=1 Tax=Pelagihabitans pacificus TaxID=2696054 RepID=A0A967EAU3_9FLAO|nr:NlpC/P60 family protein [Pelagihabitans pacificus]NHF59761.1 C40 family peptidase [Pelagihabitans pacificus]
MQYGICSLSLVPVRMAADEISEMVTQLLYGEHFKVLESRKYFSKIRVAYDGCEGWVNNNQIIRIEEAVFERLQTATPAFASDLVSYLETDKKRLIPVLLGSSVASRDLWHHHFDGKVTEGIQDKAHLVETSLYFLGAPQLRGGKSPFGIDSAGLTQMVYKINGHRLLRTAQQQSGQGDALSFIEESEPGDLAFFDNRDGEIDHVGIIMKDNHIIHVHGKVRIDRLDHTGIFNGELGNYTHQLRVIKKLI